MRSFTDTLYCTYVYNKSLLGTFHILFVIKTGRITVELHKFSYWI